MIDGALVLVKGQWIGRVVAQAAGQTALLVEPRGSTQAEWVPVGNCELVLEIEDNAGVLAVRLEGGARIVIGTTVVPGTGG